MRYTPKILSVLSLSILGTALSPMAAQAAGFYIQEQSVAGLGAGIYMAVAPQWASIVPRCEHIVCKSSWTAPRPTNSTNQ